MQNLPADYVKTCSRCGESKPATQFQRSTTTRDGLQSRCKACQKELAKEDYRKNPERRRAAYEKWRLKNLPKTAALARKWRKNNRERSADHGLKANYGIPIGTYAKLLAAQNGRCAICGTDKPGGRGRFHVDHCHDTGLIRGLLCHNCNVGIGHFRHSIDLLTQSISYLTDHQPKVEVKADELSILAKNS